MPSLIYHQNDANLQVYGDPVSTTNPVPVQTSGPFPVGATAITAASGNVAAAAAVATLPGVANKTTYITGFTITGGGATAAALVLATLVGCVSGTLTFVYGAVAGAALASQALVVSFDTPIPASAVNTAIVLTLPSLGAGNTNAAVTARGFQL